MNSKYEQKFQKIIEKYHLEQTDTGDDSSKINSLIINLFKERCYGKVTALWGAGRNNSQNSHASVIINKYATYIQNLTCVIDSFSGLQGKKFLSLPVIAPADIKKNNIEIIIIASKGSADSIKEDIEYFAPGCEYIDIYDELKKNGITIFHEFFREASVYTHLFDIKEQYMNTTVKEEKQDFLKKLISVYLSIRDISYAFEFIDEYCNEGYSDKEVYANLKTEIGNLVEQIKTENQKRKDDIAIYLIDSLRAMDIFDQTQGKTKFKILSDYLKDSVYFTNVRSTGVTTYESMMSIIGQKMPFDDNVYNGNLSFSFEQCDMLIEAEKMGYHIKFYVPEEYKIIKQTSKIEYDTHLYFSEKIWNMACDMAESKEKTFCFAYFPYEMHFPLICGYHTKRPKACGFADVGIEDMSEFIEDQFESCKAYMEREMKYFRNYFSDDIATVVFSDHSQVVFDDKEQKPYFMYYNNLDRSVHATFFAKGKNITPREENELFSLIDFNKIIQSIIHGRDISVPKCDIVRYQYYNIHNKQLREYAIEHGYSDYVNGMNCFASADYIYILTATGKEEVYAINHIRENIINTEEGKIFAERIKQNYDYTFPDFIKENL